MLSNSFMLVLFALFASALCDSESKYCPQKEWLKPCTCEDNVITCAGNATMNLPRLFTSLRSKLTPNEKHFNQFRLENTMTEELKENTFTDITFDYIFIRGNKRLARVHRNAFTATNWWTKTVIIRDNPMLSQMRDNSLFDVLSKFVNVETISLLNNNITAIPDHAFRPVNGYQSQLKDVRITGLSVRSLGRNVFAYLDNISVIDISGTRIGYVPENAFTLLNVKPSKMLLILGGNPLMTSGSFAPNVFVNIGRRVDLILSATNYIAKTPKQITYLSEKVFLPFLKASDDNTVGVDGELIDCQDCRSYWLTKYPKLLARVEKLKCANGKAFTDNANFAKCVDFLKK